MESRLPKYPRQRENPPVTFSLTSCLCGDDSEDSGSGDESGQSLLPAISISPILIRRFAVIGRYLDVRGPDSGLGAQHVEKKEMPQASDMVEEKKTINEKDCVDEKGLIKEEIFTKEESFAKEDKVADMQIGPGPKMLKLQRRGYVDVSEKQLTSLTLKSPDNRDNTTATYQYGPLKEDEIRVIVLAHAEFSEEVVLKLAVRKRTALAPYEAASYAWADKAQTDVVKMKTQHGTETLKAIPNLVTMLRLLRARNYASRKALWIDAICIDQASKSEKAVQVRRMADVYGRASQTLVWLGRDKGQLLSNLDRVWPYHKHYSIEAVRMHIEPMLTKLYFRRRWITQELFFSEKINLLDKYRELNFSILEKASEFVLKSVHHLHHRTT